MEGGVGRKTEGGREGEERWRCALLDDYYGILFFFTEINGLEPSPLFHTALIFISMSCQ